MSLENTLLPWNFRFGRHGNFFWRFCIWRVRFWCSRCNSYKDYYSDDDDLFSLDDASHSEVRDIWEAWNAQTPISKPLIPTDINTENGPKSSNSAKCNEDHSNDKGDEIPKGTSITHNYIKKEKLVYISFDIEAAGELYGFVQIRNFRISWKICCFQGSVSHDWNTLPVIWHFLIKDKP